MPPPPTLPVWASEIQDRRPKFKLHQTRGQAINAVHYTLYYMPRGGIVYKQVNGEWVEDYRCEPNHNCVVCKENVPFKETTVISYHTRIQFRRIAHRACIKNGFYFKEDPLQYLSDEERQGIVFEKHILPYMGPEFAEQAKMAELMKKYPEAAEKIMQTMTYFKGEA